VKIGQWVGVVIGVWLMAAPAALDYARTGASDVHRTVGPLVTTCAVVALWTATRDVRWANVALGAVLFVAPAFGRHPTDATVVGFSAAIVLGATAPLGGRDTERRGGGWRAIVREEGGGTWHGSSS
jgi:hypothetical protein